MKETLLGSVGMATGILFCVLTSGVWAEEPDVAPVMPDTDTVRTDTVRTDTVRTDTVRTDTVDNSDAPRTDATELTAIMGKWEREVKTNGGIVRIVKEHDKDSTTVTVYDPQGTVLTAKVSKFRLETKGKVRIFTFYDNLIIAGPRKGQANKQPKSYIYRVLDDKFFEVQGMLIDEAEDPGVLVWRRVKE